MVDFLYRAADGQFKPMPADGARPADLTLTTTSDGRTVDYVVRRERGTSNRFIYAITMLADETAWNHRVIYRFDGGVVAMKDPTRGGVASALHEMASKSRVGILLDERAVPVSPAIRAAAELLGIDPLHVAHEGKALLGVRGDAVEKVLAALREHPLGRHAEIIGTCLEEHAGRVILDTGLGRRLLAEPEGEPLPRIC